jgi:ferredoxin
MRIDIDLELCAGTAVCMSTAPEIFDVSAEGQSSVRADIAQPVDRQQLQRAISNCPMGAISTTTDDEEM